MTGSQPALDGHDCQEPKGLLCRGLNFVNDLTFCQTHCHISRVTLSRLGGCFSEVLAFYLHEPFHLLLLRKYRRAQRRNKGGWVPLDGQPISFSTLSSYFSPAGEEICPYTVMLIQENSFFPFLPALLPLIPGKNFTREFGNFYTRGMLWFLGSFLKCLRVCFIFLGALAQAVHREFRFIAFLEKGFPDLQLPSWLPNLHAPIFPLIFLNVADQLICISLLSLPLMY